MFRRQQGRLFLEDVCLPDVLPQLSTPCYLYSKHVLLARIAAYQQALSQLPPLADGSPRGLLAYAVKANPSLALLQLIARRGLCATVVSAHEITHARRAGFAPGDLLLHGTAKRTEDLDAALAASALVSIDSAFDLTHLLARLHAPGASPASSVRILLRVNPNIDPGVHPHISTGLSASKFGLSIEALHALRPLLIAHPALSVCGLHCHLGSTLRSAAPILAAAQSLLPILAALRQDGHSLHTLDLGGGLGIDYHRDGTTACPAPTALTEPLASLLIAQGLRLWLEPGRSLIGPAGVLLSRVIGLKPQPPSSAEPSCFLAVDASMAQLVRPALYDAYHHMELLDERHAGPVQRFDVVGPVCESADVLGRQRLLPTPAEGDGLAIYDVGAYGSAMASRYNLQLLPAEYLVDGAALHCIRRAETYEDFVSTQRALP
jgi:diaminopimelate decarboxylase